MTITSDGLTLTHLQNIESYVYDYVLSGLQSFQHGLQTECINGERTDRNIEREQERIKKLKIKKLCGD